MREFNGLASYDCNQLKEVHFHQIILIFYDLKFQIKGLKGKSSR